MDWLRQLLGPTDAMALLADQARYYRADQESRGGGRVADFYNDASNAGAYYTMPSSTDPNRRYNPAVWRDYLLDAMLQNRTSNPFRSSEADLSAGYPPSGLLSDHRMVYPLRGLLAPGDPEERW